MIIDFCHILHLFHKINTYTHYTHKLTIEFDIGNFFFSHLFAKRTKTKDLILMKFVMCITGLDPDIRPQIGFLWIFDRELRT